MFSCLFLARGLHIKENYKIKMFKKLKVPHFGFLVVAIGFREAWNSSLLVLFLIFGMFHSLNLIQIVRIWDWQHCNCNSFGRKFGNEKRCLIWFKSPNLFLSHSHKKSLTRNYIHNISYTCKVSHNLLILVEIHLKRYDHINETKNYLCCWVKLCSHYIYCKRKLP